MAIFSLGNVIVICHSYIDPSQCICESPTKACMRGVVADRAYEAISVPVGPFEASSGLISPISFNTACSSSPDTNVNILD